MKGAEFVEDNVETPEGRKGSDKASRPESELLGERAGVEEEDSTKGGGGER